MKRSIQAVALMAAVSLAATWVAFRCPPAMAQMPKPQSVTGIVINYVEPTDPAHRAIYDRLRKRQVLEQYKEFMSPLQLKRALSVALQGCDGQVNAWYSNGKITYCYEMVAVIENVVAKANPLPGFKLEDAIVGAFVQILLHETSHAVFDLLDVPLFGREEDAADALAEFVLLQFGEPRLSWRRFFICPARGGDLGSCPPVPTVPMGTPRSRKTRILRGGALI